MFRIEGCILIRLHIKMGMLGKLYIQGSVENISYWCNETQSLIEKSKQRRRRMEVLALDLFRAVNRSFQSRSLVRYEH